MSYILGIIGLLLIFLEFFLPGGVMGVAGAILVIVSIVFYAINAEGFLPVVLYILAMLFCVGVLMRFALWRLKTGKMKGIYLNTAQEGYVASKFAKELIGQDGEALSDLKPSGHILVADKRYQAVSKMGYIVKGTKIEVVGGEGSHLIVKEKK